MKRRGQSALEFVMVYGWAILGVIVSIGALFYFGVSPQKYLPNTCFISNNFACLEYGVYDEREVYILAKNTLDRGKLDNIYMTLVRENGGVCDMGQLGEELLSGESKMFFSNTADNDCLFTLGERVDLRADLRFKVEGGVKEHFVTGRVRTMVDSDPSGGFGDPGECQGICAETAEEARAEDFCSDGIDNDFDGDIDCADPDCADDPACPQGFGFG